MEIDGSTKWADEDLQLVYTTYEVHWYPGVFCTQVRR